MSGTQVGYSKTSNPEATDLDGLLQKIRAGGTGLMFDIRLFGGSCDWVDIAGTPTATDNYGPLQAAINAASIKGGRVFIPAGKCYLSAGVQIKQRGVHVSGEGVRASWIIFEPTAPGVLFDFMTDALDAETTLGPCSISEISMWGFPGFQSNPACHAKVAIRSTCTSEFRISNIDVNDWLVNAANSGEGPSIGIQYRGKELCTVDKVTIFASRPISLEKNPRELVFSIDADLLHLRDVYLGIMDPNETGILIAPNMRVLSFVMDGSNVIVSGKKAISCVDTTGNLDWVFFTVKGLRYEQAVGTAGCTIEILRTGSGRTYNTHFEDINLGFTVKGIHLDGCILNTIMNCAYLEFAATPGWPKALKLSGYTWCTRIINFIIPPQSENLVDTTGQAVTEAGVATAFSQIPMNRLYN